MESIIIESGSNVIDSSIKKLPFAEDRDHPDKSITCSLLLTS